MLASTRRDCCMRCPYTTFHRFQCTALPTKYARGSSRSHRDVVMLFCPSFTQSEPPDFDVLNQQRVVVMTDFIRTLSGNRERVQVRCSDLVGSDLPHLVPPWGCMREKGPSTLQSYSDSLSCKPGSPSFDAPSQLAQCAE